MAGARTPVIPAKAGISQRLARGSRVCIKYIRNTYKIHTSDLGVVGRDQPRSSASRNASNSGSLMAAVSALAGNPPSFAARSNAVSAARRSCLI